MSYSTVTLYQASDLGDPIYYGTVFTDNGIDLAGIMLHDKVKEQLLQDIYRAVPKLDRDIDSYFTDEQYSVFKEAAVYKNSIRALAWKFDTDSEITKQRIAFFEKEYKKAFDELVGYINAVMQRPEGVNLER